MASEFMEWDCLVDKQLMSDRYGDHQRVLPDRLGNNVVADFGRVREPDGEVAGTQTAQLLGQRHFGQANLNVWLFSATTGEKIRQPGINCAIGYCDAQATSRARCNSLGILSCLFQHGE
ncbi:hypothetical protein ABB33_01060 [Stenotrophomonas acidaminiphila]|nr:hypothetical protein ABB33_01060 [Stenotrophomonas acidaminiphila]